MRLDGAGMFVVGEPIAGLGGNPLTSGIIHFYRPERSVGTTYCNAVANSTQNTGGIDALGSALVVDDQVTLVAYNLPYNSFGFFLASRTTATIPQPGGSLGVLCIGGAIGRYVGPGQIRNTGNVGFFGLPLDLGATPTPTGLVAIAPGESWHFQTWHRDSVGGLARSNFTNAVSVPFQ